MFKTIIMKNKIKRVCFLLILIITTTTTITPQVFGPEILINGSFGTISTAGMNGDDISDPANSRSQSIYPDTPDNIPIYYQPVNYGYYGWYQPPYVNLEEYINTNVTIGHHINAQTSYTWGMSVLDYSIPIFFLMNQVMLLLHLFHVLPVPVIIL